MYDVGNVGAAEMLPAYWRGGLMPHWIFGWILEVGGSGWL